MAALRDVSVILLAIESFVLLLIPAAVIAATWYGVHWLRRKLPSLFAQARKYLVLIQLCVNHVCGAVVAPLIAASARVAQLSAWWNTLARFVKEEN
jgi:hypothetical protein